MKIITNQANCKHLEMSVYNHNYYELPFTVNECNVVLEHYNGCEDFVGYSLGVFVDGKFIEKYWLHTDNKHEVIEFDSNELKDHNEWT